MNYIIRTDVFGVQPFSEHDIDNVVSWMSRSAEELFMVSSSLQYPLLKEQFIEYVQKCKPDEHRLYSVYSVENSKHVGHFEIKAISARHKCGTAAHIILDPRQREKKLGHHLAALIAHVGFYELKLYRIGLSVHTTNVKAHASYIRAGYIDEGIIREVLTFQNKRYSLYQMSLLQKEWAEKSHVYPVYL